MNQTYSFLIGVRNTLIGFAAFSVGLYFAAHPEVANTGVVDFISTHLKAAIGTVTVGGVANLILDYLHQKYSIAAAQAKQFGGSAFDYLGR